MLTAADNRADPPTAGPTSYDASYPMWQGVPHRAQDPSVLIPASSGPYDKACQGSRHLLDLRPCPTTVAPDNTV